MPLPARTDERSPVWSALEVSLAVGVACAAAYGTYDVVVRMGLDHTLTTAGAGAAVWLAVGVLLGLSTGLVLAPIALLAGPRLDAGFVRGALVASGIQATALLASESPVALVAGPVAIVIGSVTSRSRLRARPGGMLLAALLFGVATLALARGLLAIHERRPFVVACAIVALALGSSLSVRWMARRALLASGGLALSAALVAVSFLPPGTSPRARAASPPAAAEARPNVVVIVLDTTRRDHFGAYGDRRGLTPRFDAFAREATLYEDALTPSEWTVPNHATLFTGLAPAVHGASFATHRWLAEENVTLAERLRDAGFETIGFSANRYLVTSNLQQGFERFELTVPFKGSRFHALATLLGWPSRAADAGSTRTVEELGRWLAARDGARPFLLFVNLIEPHAPYTPTWRERRARLPAGTGVLAAAQLGRRFAAPEALARGEALDPHDAETIRALYAAEVAYQDRRFGEILDRLAAAVDLDRTVVVVTADHGENLGDGLRWDHAFAVNEALVHVPLAIRFPARFPKGARVAGQCGLVDVAPTLLELLGLDPLDGSEGRSLLPDRFVPRELAYLESFPFWDHLAAMATATGMQRDVSRFTRSRQAVRTLDWKLVRTSDGRETLRDLHADPEEVGDASAAHPEVVARLAPELRRWIAEQDALRGGAEHAAPAPARGLSPDEIEQLRSLGYLQ